MAVTIIANGINQASGIKYTVITDSSSDWGSVSNDVYFYDKGTQLSYYKNSNGTVVKIYETKIFSETTSTASLTVNSDTTDLAILTAQAVALTINAPTGSPIQGQLLNFRIKDDGTGRGITLNAIFTDYTGSMPSTTTASKTLYFSCRYNSSDTKWDILAVQEQP